MNPRRRQGLWGRFGRTRKGERKPSLHLSFHPVVELLEARIALDDNSVGPDGIDARGLGSTGNGIKIGQVEPDRPAKKPFDTQWNVDVTPADSFVRNRRPVRPNEAVDSHPEAVAGIMNANGSANKGVAPNAQLYSSAEGTHGNQNNAAVAMQAVVNKSVVAI